MTDVRASGGTETTAPFGEKETEFDGTPGGATAGPPAPGANWLLWGWRQLTSMRTALILLFLLALGSVPGSVLPQQGIDPQAVQQYYAAHPALAPWLARFSLFNVFGAPWFAASHLLLFFPRAAGAALAASSALLAGKRFRVRAGDGWISAEKGYLREAGNLLFHLALLALLAAVGMGGLFGYKANRTPVAGWAFG